MLSAWASEEDGSGGSGWWWSSHASAVAEEGREAVDASWQRGGRRYVRLIGLAAAGAALAETAFHGGASTSAAIAQAFVFLAAFSLL